MARLKISKALRSRWASSGFIIIPVPPYPCGWPRPNPTEEGLQSEIGVLSWPLLLVQQRVSLGLERFEFLAGTTRMVAQPLECLLETGASRTGCSKPLVRHG